MNIKRNIVSILVIVISMLIGIGIGIIGARTIPVADLHHPVAPSVQLAQHRVLHVHEGMNLHVHHAELVATSPLLPLHVL